MCFAEVYSIWLVSSPKAVNRNTIARFRIVKDDIFGKSEYNEGSYNLMTGIFVNLNTGDDTVENKLLRFMNKVLDSKTSAQEKERFIEDEYHIPMTEEVKEEVNNMGSFSDALLADNTREVTEQVTEQVTENVTNKIIDNMLKANFSTQQIITASGKDDQYIENRRKALHGSKI